MVPMQFPLWHWPLRLQAKPLGPCGWQLPAPIPLHQELEMQLASPVVLFAPQAVRHDVAFAQMKLPGQAIGVLPVQLPEPSQFPAGVIVEPEHDALLHMVVLGGNTHMPAVLQPVAPQVPPDGLHDVVQQLPMPEVPQRALVHWSFAVHGVPAPTLF
jgi:hypothetical protein